MLDSDLFFHDEVHVRTRYGAHAFVLAVQLFVDEAVVSWSGAQYVCPIRARILNVRDSSVQCVIVGYVPHVWKAVARTAGDRRRASDGRYGDLQRCLAIVLCRFVEASKTGVLLEFPGRETLAAVPPLLGLVADQLGEESVMCLMENAGEIFCSHCVVRRDVASGTGGVGALARSVTAVLDAQLEGAVARDRDPQPSLRKQLKTEHSALAFLPAVGAVWGLATGSKRLCEIISFDILPVWKLGILRMVAQRFSSFLRVACAGRDARLGPVGETLDALSLRAWEMGHLNVPSPTPPGFFVPPLQKQLQMTGRLWGYGVTIMPHIVAGLGGPAEGRRVRHGDAALASVAIGVRRSAVDGEELEDGHGPDGVALEAAEKVLPDSDAADVTSSAKHRRLYGELPLHRAVLDDFYRMAALGGRLMGDNMADTVHMTELQMRTLADEAKEFIVEHVDLLFGPAHTTKAHRSANHLLAALLGNGNLWRGTQAKMRRYMDRASGWTHVRTSAARQWYFN
eukprot:TRINITY_DN5301_c0_g1_i1.p1 TRINITY_DN5301_c0_g1~~TRINITY_DN5301_c0_g1_i1.p1  ORF type:complete len:511 (-),score=44.11 TRINITY_DN5301_c0_g1_i1:515-2047(-)